MNFQRFRPFACSVMKNGLKEVAKMLAGEDVTEVARLEAEQLLKHGQLRRKGPIWKAIS